MCLMKTLTILQPAGCKAGTFDPYPSHSADPYKMKIHRPVNVVNKSGKIFTPSQGPKSTPTVSIVDRNVTRYEHVELSSFIPTNKLGKTGWEENIFPKTIKNFGDKLNLMISEHFFCQKGQ